jgi:competence protein ComEA
MWKRFIKDYLTFSKKERTGVVLLLLLIAFVFSMSYWWPQKPSIPVAEKKLKQLSAQLDSLNTPPQKKNYTKQTYTDEDAVRTSYYDAPGNASLFYFNPNTLNAGGWKQLGLRDKTIQTILKYRSKGGRFKTPQDLGKIYGLRPEELNRILPYVKMDKEPVPSINYREDDGDKNTITNYNKPYTAAIKTVDINTSDTTAFIALPGIGSKLASRIINFRNKLGGFYAVEQVAETYGLPDSTFQRIKSFLQLGNNAVHQFSVNTDDAKTLQQHPYIKWNIANAIVQYRQQHGAFKNLDELEQIAIISAEQLKKMKPYLKL